VATASRDVALPTREMLPLARDLTFPEGLSKHLPKVQSDFEYVALYVIVASTLVTNPCRPVWRSALRAHCAKHWFPDHRARTAFAFGACFRFGFLNWSRGSCEHGRNASKINPDRQYNSTSVRHLGQ
jgi:hypothetical protein